ncbi:tetratricopeptide repeat protein [Rhizobium panacihumi]|uniref:tetratricopeptide repeat protein n=1 Tax=Rhizobium panacihumi TaxID=2008450 RepID=UPI003D7BED46
MFRRILYLILLCQLFTFSPAFAEMNEGDAAYAAGDYSKAHEIWLISAEKGDPDAQVSLGTFYAAGLGVEQNFDEAAKWYRRAADQNSPAGLYFLGMMHFTGKGVKEDLIAATQFIGRASDAGFEPAKAAVSMYRFMGLDMPGTGLDLDKPLTAEEKAVMQKLKSSVSKNGQ